MFQKNYNILSTWILLLLLFPSTLLVAQTEIKDADNDTKVETERTADDDIIRFRSGGIDRLRMVGARIEPLSNGNSIFLGSRAGENDDLSNNRNAFIGFQAGLENINGAFNSAIGFAALQSNVNGSLNTAIGLSALRNHTNSTSNLAIGYNTGAVLTAGNFNSFIGARAGSAITSGNANTFIGNEAGRNVTSGDANTYIGSYAGRNAGTGSRNVFIGNLAGENETGSDKLYIANSNTSTPLIGGDFAAKDVFINGRERIDQTDASKYALEVYHTVNQAPMSVGGIGASRVNFSVAGSGNIGQLGALNAGTMGISSVVGKDIQLLTSNATRLTVAANGNVGINDPAPADRLVVKDSVVTGTGAVIHGIYTETSATDRAAIRGTSVPTPGYGYGVIAEGGYRGVQGSADGGDTNFSLGFFVAGGYFTATGTGTAPGLAERVGVYGSATGGNTNWAGYFNSGNVYVKDTLRVGDSAGKTDYIASFNGKVVAEEMLIQDSGDWPDYVFTTDYDLAPLSEVKAHIVDKGHLPGVPSASEVAETGGAMVGQMQRVLLEKVEETTLHLIAAEERANAAELRVEMIEAESKAQTAQLEARLAKLEALILDQQD